MLLILARRAFNLTTVVVVCWNESWSTVGRGDIDEHTTSNLRVFLAHVSSNNSIIPKFPSKAHSSHLMPALCLDVCKSMGDFDTSLNWKVKQQTKTASEKDRRIIHILEVLFPSKKDVVRGSWGVCITLQEAPETLPLAFYDSKAAAPLQAHKAWGAGSKN